MADFIEKYGPWAIVTGANAGIGKAIATELAARGINIVAVARRQSLLDELQQELSRDYGVEVRTINADLTDPTSISKIELVTSDLEVGLVVPNAGVELSGMFIHSSLEANEKMLQLNVTAPCRWQKFSARKWPGAVAVACCSSPACSATRGFRMSPIMRQPRPTSCHWVKHCT